MIETKGILKELDRVARKYPNLKREEHTLIRAYQIPLFQLVEDLKGRLQYEENETKKHYEDRIFNLAKHLLLTGGTSFYNKAAKDAQDKLLNHNLRLVLRLTKKANPNLLEGYDLFVAGCRGLLHSLDKFSLEKKNKDGESLKFSTPTYNWVRQYIQRAMQDGDAIIRIPIHIHDQINKLKKQYAQYTEHHPNDPNPSYEIISQLTGFDIETCKRLGRYINPKNMGSLDEESDTDEGTTAYEFLEADVDKYDPAGANLERNFNKQALLSLIRQHLNEEDQKFCLLRYGILDGVDRNEKEMGSALSIKVKEVRRREAEIIAKLQKVAKAEEFCL